jgi:transposase-like protein
MHRSKIPIQEWFWAAYLVATHTPGISARQIQRQIGISSYESAWYLLQRLRKGMVNDSRMPLKELVEADETFIGGPAKNQKGRGVTKAPHKALVIGAVEVVQYVDKKNKPKEKAGRLRLAVIDRADEKTIESFLKHNVEKGSKVRTDGWRGYSETALAEYRHAPQVQGSPKRAHQLAPHVHRVFSNLKTWLAGTYHGVEPKYLQGYLDEFVFRFNRRSIPMAAFQTLLGITASKKPVTLHKIRSPESTG